MLLKCGDRFQNKEFLSPTTKTPLFLQQQQKFYHELAFCC